MKYEYQTIATKEWKQCSAEKLLFLLLPMGIVTAYRNERSTVEVACISATTKEKS